jgi:hypothetical protein
MAANAEALATALALVAAAAPVSIVNMNVGGISITMLAPPGGSAAAPAAEDARGGAPKRTRCTEGSLATRPTPIARR